MPHHYISVVVLQYIDDLEWELCEYIFQNGILRIELTQFLLCIHYIVVLCFFVTYKILPRIVFNSRYEHYCYQLLQFTLIQKLLNIAFICYVNSLTYPIVSYWNSHRYADILRMFQLIVLINKTPHLDRTKQRLTFSKSALKHLHSAAELCR